MSELSRLRWRCRRGIKEMDIILQRFLEQDYSTLSLKEKALFDQILDETDLDILDWMLMRTQPANTNYEMLLALFRQHKPDKI
jgi:antitoxin CptB